MARITDYKIIRSLRTTISLHITGDGKLIVKAPLFIPELVIQQFINNKKEWILKGLEKVSIRKAKPKEYKNGEVFLYLGREYQLRTGNYKEIVFTTSNTLRFPNFLLFRVQKELENWYKKKAKEIITERIKYRAGKMNAHYKSIIFSDTKSKWGTCGPENDLQFNWRLVMAPLVVVDYVVIHELVHTTEKNHSSKFWRKVAAATPAYRQHKKWLNSHSHLLTF